MPTRFARRHASLKMTEGENGLLICPLMAEEFFDLVLLCLGHVQIFSGALGVVIRQSLAGMFQIGVHQLLRRDDVAAQVQALRAERVAHSVEALNSGSGAAGGFVDVLLDGLDGFFASVGSSIAASA